jgi:hypothetical protein
MAISLTGDRGRAVAQRESAAQAISSVGRISLSARGLVATAADLQERPRGFLGTKLEKNDIRWAAKRKQLAVRRYSLVTSAGALRRSVLEQAKASKQRGNVVGIMEWLRRSIPHIKAEGFCFFASLRCPVLRLSTSLLHQRLTH